MIDKTEKITFPSVMIFGVKVPKTRSGGIAPGVYKRLRTNIDRFDKSWEFCQCRFIQCVLNSTLLLLNQLIPGTAATAWFGLIGKSSV